VFLGLPVESNFGDVAPITVPARNVVVFDPYDESADASIPDGRHSVVFSAPGEPSIVVERVLTRPASGSPATSVVLGSPPRQDGFVPYRWHVGIGPSTPTEEGLVVFNVDNVEASVTVEAVGPGGPSPVPSRSRTGRRHRPDRGGRARPRADRHLDHPCLRRAPAAARRRSRRSVRILGAAGCRRLARSIVDRWSVW
jgi:hypothetical protein